MLELKQLAKSFGDHKAVQSVSFKLEKGEVLGFLGPNGAGKSTTMRMVAVVIEPDQGDVLIAGHSAITARREAQRRLGYLPEGAPLYKDMTPVEFLNFMAAAHHMERASRKAAIDRVIADARIANVAYRRIGNLSKGYRRRVGLAGALLQVRLRAREGAHGPSPATQDALKAGESV